MAIKKINSYQQFLEILKSDRPAVIDFEAAWCEPCRFVVPWIFRRSEMHSSVDFYKLDTDEQEEIAKEVGIVSLPTIVALHNGKKIKEVRGPNRPLIEINGDEPAIFDFWATWCGPFRVISPIFSKLSDALSEVDCYKVDVDDQSQISEEVGIRAMPTFIAFHNGNKIKEVVGASPQKLEMLVAETAQLTKA